MATFDMVFEGGGAKGTAFVGALEVLFAAGHKHRRLVGTSAGAITATLLGAGYSPQEFLNAVNETVPGTGAPIFTTFLDAPQIADFGQQTINNSETKQVSMLGATAVPVVKRYVVDGQQFYYRNAQHPGAPLKDVVQVYYQLRNDTKNGLGMPMPAGNVRVYQADSKGNLQFVGEDRISHTPADETINLKIGNAFDVVAERKQLDFEKIASGVYEVEYEVALRNHKTVPVSVEVNEPIGGTWRILRSTHEWTKSEAWAAQFVVPVPAEGAATLKYRVRVTY